VLDVGDARRQDSRFFAALQRELDAGGYQALLHELLTFDLADVPLRTIPQTMALATQKTASMSSEQKWWLDVLREGMLPGDEEGTGVTPTRALYDDYIEHAKTTGVPRRSTETMLGTFLQKLFDGRELRRRRSEPRPDGRVSRPYVYEFPPLAECRQRFDEAFGQPIAWGHRDDTWQPSHAPPLVTPLTVPRRSAA
jgi:hypothetical protein